MATHALAKKLQEKGRGPDTILAHITPEEAALLEAHGGSGTINPETGLPEYLPDWLTGLWDKFTGFVRQYAPIIMPAVAIFVPELIPSIGTWLGATTTTGAAVLGSAALSAGVTFAAGGSLKDVLTSAALGGASAYLTPVLGQKIGTAVGVTGAVGTQLIGSAATAGGLAALRGGSAKQIIAAAATGAASSYLAGIARDSFATLNEGMAAGKIGQVTEKAAKDAVFVAADAANLKAAGLTESQIATALKDSGVNSAIAENAAKYTMQGRATSEVAASLATSGNAYGTADPATKSITAGNNIKIMQQVEDAVTIGQDAAQLKAQGLSQAQIKENLVASGVSDAVATSAAQKAVGGVNATDIASQLQSYYKSTTMYDNTTNVVGRNLGQAMTAQQQEAWNAVPYKTAIDAGQITAADATVLKANGYTPADVTKLTALGYTGADLVDLASTGVTATSLTGLGDTKFAETNINDMLHAGASINDISYASRLVGTGTISADNAQKLLMKDFTGNQIYNIGSKGDALATKIADSNLNNTTVDKLISGGWDLNKALTLSSAGTDINKMVADGDWKGVQAAFNAPVTAPTTPTTTGPVAPTVLPTEPMHYTGGTAADIDFAIADAKQLAAQGLKPAQITQVMQASGMNAAAAQYLGSYVSRATDATLKADLNSMARSTLLYGKEAVPTTTSKSTETTTPTPAPAPVTLNPNQTLLDAGLHDYGIRNLQSMGYTNEQIQGMIDSGKSLSTIEYYAANGRKDLLDPLLPKATPVAPAPAPTPTPVETPTIPVKMPDGTVGTYDPTTGDVHDAVGTKIVDGSQPTTTPSAPVETAGPYRVEISGQPATDLMTPLQRAEYLKAALPEGTVIANPNTPNAYYDTASNAWVVRAAPPQITQPIAPVEIPPTSQLPPPIEAGPPIAPAPAPAEPELGPSGPSRFVAPEGSEPVYDELGNTYYFSPSDGRIYDTVGKIIYEPPAPVQTQPAPVVTTPPVTPQPAPAEPELGPPITAPVAPQPTPAEPVTPVAPAPVPAEPELGPPATVPAQPAPYVPPPGTITVVGQDNKDYYYNPTDGKVTDTDGKVVYEPPVTPAPPTNQPPVTQPPVTTPETPLKPLEPVEIKPSEPIPEVPADDTNPPSTEPPPPTVPPTILPTPIVPTPTPSGSSFTPLPFATLPLLPNPGLNPGFIQAQEQYQTTSPVQSKYYWGQHPYQSGGPTNQVFDPNLYKQVSAPVQPWGLQELYTPTNIAQYLAQLQQSVVPVKP